MKAILIGRHIQFEIPDLEIIEMRNVLFPATAKECLPVLQALMQDADIAGAYLLFQAVPSQLTAVLAKLAHWKCLDEFEGTLGGLHTCEVWAIINKPTDRPEVRTEIFKGQEFVDLPGMKVGIGFVNPNAKCEWVDDGASLAVTVEPPMRFEFSHLERIL